MSHFKTALADVLKHEGGYVDHQNDNGGATAFGISLRFLSALPALAGDVNGDGHVNKDDVKALSIEDADTLYEKEFWLHYRLDEVTEEMIAVKLMNFFVNMRGKTAALIAQRAANDLGAGLVEDGILGSKSIAVLNELEAMPLLVCIKYQAWQVYKAIVVNTPSQAVFINGWRKRAFA
tara:strand:- start:384 stop:917 length:534 start_codon:yes stop_codon:yes gene_type:complete